MKTIKTISIKENQKINKIYSTYDEALIDLIESVNRSGILQPLIVRPIGENLFEVISGNRRLRAAKYLKLEEVPVIIKELEKVDNSLIVEHNSQRVKKPSEILKEVKIIRKKYGIKQGVRSDKNKDLKEGQLKIKELHKKHTKTKIDRLLSIDKHLQKLANSNPEIAEKELQRLDRSGSVNGTLKRLQNKVKILNNKSSIGEKYEIKLNDFKVYQKSSDNLKELADNSVSCIVTSPPYFDIRNYNLGQNELGHDANSDAFVVRLVNHFDDSKRVLKNDGTMWVNLGDYVKNHGYTAVPEKFLVKMLEKGWILHDKITWVKNNPNPISGNRTQTVSEFIYVFKKKPFVSFDPSWIKNYPYLSEFTGYGKVKLKSVFDFRGSIIRTNSANNSSLQKACKEQGFSLTHSATFPLAIPFIAIKTSTKPGDLVVDLFNGTGTTGRAAKLMRRKYVGYDLNPDYIKQSEIRFNMDLEEDLDQAA